MSSGKVFDRMASHSELETRTRGNAASASSDNTCKVQCRLNANYTDWLRNSPLVTLFINGLQTLPIEMGKIPRRLSDYSIWRSVNVCGHCLGGRTERLRTRFWNVRNGTKLGAQAAKRRHHDVHSTTVAFVTSRVVPWAQHGVAGGTVTSAFMRQYENDVVIGQKEPNAKWLLDRPSLANEVNGRLT